MLSAGTRIGPYHVQDWIREGSCGQSYFGQGSLGEERGKFRYVKLFHRDLSEKKGFTDYFSQECGAIQQLEGRGIWPMLGSGTLKWKHWMSFAWFEGHSVQIPNDVQGKEPNDVSLKTLDDWLAYDPSRVGPKDLNLILVDMHCGLNRAHAYGVIHGNLKPSNVLLDEQEDGSFVSWMSEFALAKICSFQPLGDHSEEGMVFSSQSMQYQKSLKESQAFRPKGISFKELPEESWDISALGAIVRYVIEKSNRPTDEWLEWQKWACKAVDGSFLNVVQSMKALPGVEDLSHYGIHSEKECDYQKQSTNEIRRQRELEWDKKQKISSATFRRNMTGLVGCVCLITFLFSKLYLYLNPSPWVEYRLEGVSDRYQLGFGIWSGKAWGILPAAYDDGGEGGQDVAGEWERVDGIFQLNFRKFKKAKEEESGKKLWQFIGKGSTSSQDYYAWTDYLYFDRNENKLSFVKRVHQGDTFLAGKRAQDPPRLYPEVRIRRSGGIIKETKLLFEQSEVSGPSWSFFIGVGFLLASSLYHRNMISIIKVEPIKD